MHAELLHREIVGLYELRMFDHELVTDGENGRVVAMQQIVNAHERFEKIDDDVGACAFDGFADRVEAFANLGNLRGGGEDGAADGDAAIFFLREGRAGDALNIEGLLEEGWQRAFGISAGEDGDDFVAVAFEKLLHRDGLSHVAAAFALDGEHYLHAIGEFAATCEEKAIGKWARWVRRASSGDLKTARSARVDCSQREQFYLLALAGTQVAKNSACR